MQRSFIVTVLVFTLVPLLAVAAERQRGIPGPAGDVVAGAGAPFILDPSFEAGTPNPVWTEMSTNFGTPLCDEPSCGLGTGTGPYTGSWWAWFGGIAAFEEGSVSQLVTVPQIAGTTLSFWLETPVCSGDPSDFVEVVVDGTQVFLFDGDDPGCNTVGYRPVKVDISGAMLSTTFNLEIHSIILGAGGLLSNFFIDDVVIAPVLDISLVAGCPSDGQIIVTGGTAGGQVLLLAGTAGQLTIPPTSSICPGAVIDIAAPPIPVGPFPLTDAGNLLIELTPVPEVACGKSMQALDLTSCATSNADSF